MSAPPKFIKDENGVRRINPEYKQWQAGGAGGGSAPASSSSTPSPSPSSYVPSVAPAMKNQATALPVICNLAEQQQHLGADTQSSASTAAAVSRIQSGDNAQQVGLASGDDLMTNLSNIFAKYECPMGLLEKLLGLANFEFAEMIADDSGSMRSSTDSKWPNGRIMTRWEEVHQRLKKMFELWAYVPHAPHCYIRFLNRGVVLDIFHNSGEPPQAFLNRVYRMLDDTFRTLPSGTTPAKERIAESLARFPGKRCIRYFFGDGCPNGGEDAQEAITKMLVKRANPSANPFTFLSCTNDDAQTEWMKEAEEKAPYCAELDDFSDESDEVLKDQGKAFSFTFGMHLISQLVAAFNPQDLDAMDESAPFSKQTLDNLMGYQMDEKEYAYYFREFIQAQQRRKIENKMDSIKKEYASIWPKHYAAFVTAKSALDIPAVVEFRKKVADAGSSSCVIA